MVARYVRIGWICAASACLFPTVDGLGPTTDAASTSDGSDAGAGTGYCQTLTPKVLFCEDFDEGSLTAGWDATNTTSPATATLSTSTFESPPASFLALAPNVPLSQYLRSDLEKTFTGPIGNAALTFDLYLGQVDPNTPYTKLVSLEFDGNNPAYYLYIQIPNSTTIDIADQEPTADGGVQYGDFGPSPIPALNTWTHVELDLASSGNVTTAASLLLNGTVVIPVFSLPSPDAFGNVTLEIGLAGLGGPTSGWSVQVDNVTFDTNR